MTWKSGGIHALDLILFKHLLIQLLQYNDCPALLHNHHIWVYILSMCSFTSQTLLDTSVFPMPTLATTTTSSTGYLPGPPPHHVCTIHSSTSRVTILLICCKQFCTFIFLHQTSTSFLLSNFSESQLRRSSIFSSIGEFLYSNSYPEYLDLEFYYFSDSNSG